MTCESLSSVAGAYLDDELDAGLNVQVREHLAACESCAKVQNQLLALRAAIRDNAPYYRAPADLSHRVRTAVRRAERQSGGAWRWLAVAAAMLFTSGLAGVSAAADTATVKCTGVNSCKGTSDCKSAKNSCKGQNSCKGKGWTSMSKADCDAAKAKAKADAGK